MPIDANIPLQVQPLKLESPGNQLAMMSDAMKIGEMQRGIETQNKLRELYSQGVDVSTPEGFKQLASVDPASAMKLRTEAFNTRKLQAETGLKEFELDNNKINKAINDIANYDTPEAAIAGIKNSVQKGVLAPDKAEGLITSMQNKPFRQWQTTVLGSLLNAKDRLTLEETKRGHDLTDARARENLTKPVFNAEAGGWVVPPRIGKDGVASVAGTVIPVAGMTTKTTEGEKQSAFNAKRLLSAATTITKQVEKDASSTAPGTWEAMQPTEGMANLARSPERQIVASNYADLIDAALYLATGAAYNKEQLEAQRQAYLPVWSDSPENRIQKQQKTVDLINAAKIRAGKNWTPDLDVAVSKLFPTAMEQSEAAPAATATKSGASVSNW